MAQDQKICSCSQKFPWGSSQGHTIVNHNISPTLQPDFNFGFGFRDSKLSPRRVPRETQASELSVPLEVFSDRSAEGRRPQVLVLKCERQIGSLSIFPKKKIKLWRHVFPNDNNVGVRNWYIFFLTTNVCRKKKLRKLIKGFYCHWVLINLNLKSFYREILSQSKQVARIHLSTLWQYLCLKCFFNLKFWLQFNFTSRIKFDLQSLFKERDKKFG